MNYLAILVCGVVAMIIGMIWHSPKLFGRTWCRVMGYDMDAIPPEQMKEMHKKMMPTYAAQFVLSLLQAFILSSFIIPKEIGLSILVAVWMFLGFILPLVGGLALWSGKSKELAWKMFGISASFQLVVIIVYAIILSVMM